MFGLGVWELLIILAIVLLLFGPKRLKSLGSDLGSAIKGFRSAVKEEEPEGSDEQTREEKVIEGEVASSGEASQKEKAQQSPNV